MQIPKIQMRVISYKIENEPTDIRSQIVKLLSFADRVNNNNIIETKPQDDSAIQLGQKSEFLETIHFEQLEMQPLSQYVANEQSNLLDDEMMTYNNDDGS